MGKTTTSATIGLALAQRGKRVCVVTVDPAKRLAEALGVTLDNSPSKVECDVKGELHAMMLDARATFRRIYPPRRTISKGSWAVA